MHMYIHTFTFREREKSNHWTLPEYHVVLSLCNPNKLWSDKFCGWNINNPFCGLLEEKRWLTCLLQNLNGSITSTILRNTPRVPNYYLRDEFGEFYSFRCGVASCEREREGEREDTNAQTPGAAHDSVWYHWITSIIKTIRSINLEATGK